MSFAGQWLEKEGHRVATLYQLEELADSIFAVGDAFELLLRDALEPSSM